MRTTWFVALAVFTMAVVPIVMTRGRLNAQTSTPNIPAFPPQYATFGMIGLANEQTARVNALGLVISYFGLPMGGPIIAGSACSVTLEFFDDTGKSLGTSTQPVVGGQAVHFDLKRTDIDAATDRREIRATVRTSFVLSPANPMPPIAVGIGQCSVKPTLEIFNEDGRTMAVLGGTTALPLVVPLATGN
jgi:hypothetical protein